MPRLQHRGRQQTQSAALLAGQWWGNEPRGFRGRLINCYLQAVDTGTGFHFPPASSAFEPSAHVYTHPMEALACDPPGG
jgi:hypothetical protein